MRSGLVKWYAAALTACALVRPVSAQQVAIGKPSCPPPPACPAPAPLTIPATPTTPTTPETTPTAPTTPAAQEPSIDPLAFGATGGGETFAAASSAVGYIDSAIPVTQYRVRADAAWGSNRPDRADFFYPKCGGAPGGPGPAGASGNAASNVNYQELSNYLEYAPTKRFSVFGNVPLREVELTFFPPDGTAQHQGLSDIDFGFKYAAIYTPTRVLTTQLRTYAPTGNASEGLGRHNWNLEPALLYYQKLTDRLFLEGELRDFIPVAAQDDFAGNVTRYGIGMSYLVVNQRTFRVAPVGELVGWTVLSGKEIANNAGLTPVKAAGDTIVNSKFGIRTFFGEPTGNALMNRCDLYVGYGRALTGAVWYKDIMRVEFRMRF